MKLVGTWWMHFALRRDVSHWWPEGGLWLAKFEDGLQYFYHLLYNPSPWVCAESVNMMDVTTVIRLCYMVKMKKNLCRYIKVTNQFDFELLKREIILGGSDLIGRAFYNRVQKSETEEISLLPPMLPSRLDLSWLFKSVSGVQVSSPALSELYLEVVAFSKQLCPCSHS